MADYINTIDELGDDAVIDMLIEKSLTNLVDDELARVGHYALYGYPSLKTIRLPKITSGGMGVFRDCPAVEDVDFSALRSLSRECFVKFMTSGAGPSCIVFPEFTETDSYSFNVSFNGKRLKFPKWKTINAYVSSSNAKIFYFPVAETVRKYALNSNGNPHFVFSNTEKVVTLEATSVLYGSGKIFVPRALIEEYKVATNWSAFVGRLRAIEDYTVDGTVTGELDESKI